MTDSATEDDRILQEVVDVTFEIVRGSQWLFRSPKFYYGYRHGQHDVVEVRAFSSDFASGVSGVCFGRTFRYDDSGQLAQITPPNVIEYTEPGVWAQVVPVRRAAMSDFMFETRMADGICLGDLLQLHPDRLRRLAANIRKVRADNGAPPD